MPLEDLDLVFEDEEDLKKKKSDIVHSDLDLEFGASEVVKPQPSASVKPQTAPVSAPAKAAPASPTPVAVSEATTEAEPGSASVQRLEEVRAKLAAKTAQGPAAPAQKTQTAIHGATALKLTPALETESDALAEMQRQLLETKFESRVQVAVMQEKMEFITDVLSDAKLMQHQMAQLLARMNQKHPDLKPELLALQKLLADFIAKKRK